MYIVSLLKDNEIFAHLLATPHSSLPHVLHFQMKKKRQDEERKKNPQNAALEFKQNHNAKKNLFKYLT